MNVPPEEEDGQVFPLHICRLTAVNVSFPTSWLVGEYMVGFLSFSLYSLFFSAWERL